MPKLKFINASKASQAHMENRQYLRDDLDCERKFEEAKAAKKQNLSGGPGWFDAADL
jgi:hypothetical protein